MQETKETPVGSLGWEDPLEKDMATTLVFLPGESHGQRATLGYSPWGCRVVQSEVIYMNAWGMWSLSPPPPTSYAILNLFSVIKVSFIGLLPWT